MFKRIGNERTIRVGFYLDPGFSIMPFISTVEPMRMANRLSGEQLFMWDLISRDGQPVAAINGIPLVVDFAIADYQETPNLICCVGFDPVIPVPRMVRNWLRRLDRLGSHLGALGAGTLFLAEAGLLNGYRATIHWEYLGSFAERFPGTEITGNLFEVDRNRFTCAGGTAAMDMMLHFIGQNFGSDLAEIVSDEYIAGNLRHPLTGQRSAFQSGLRGASSRLPRILTAMEEHVDDPLDISRLAVAGGVSVRHMERMFRDRLGTSPLRHYLRIRLAHARRLVLQSNLTILEVATACGFKSSSHFSKAYKAEFGHPPKTDRSKARNVV